MCAAIPSRARRGATVPNGKVNEMVSDSQQHKVIKEFLIPDTLKDDIVYCQRSLRDCVKVHQYFVERCKSLPGSQRAQVKAYLLELEDEMRAIGQEQRELVDDLAKRLKHFQRKTAFEKHIVLRDDLANGYVAWVLSNHSEVNYTTAHLPHTVSERLNESQLYQKYRLEPLRARETVPSSLPDVTKVKEKRLRKRPVLQTSLLKPREERDLPSTALNEEPSLHTPPTTPPNTIPRTTGNRRKTPPETQQPLILKKMLRSSSMTTAALLVATVKEEPSTTATVKDEPIETENGNEAEDQLITAIACQESAAVKRGRSNLLQALNKAKTTQKTSPKQTTNPPAMVAAKSTRNIRAGSGNARDTQRSSSVSSDSSNSRASTPGTSSNGARKHPANLENSTSDESSLERLPIPPEEPPNTLPTCIDEWEQYSFLKLFGLYTIEDSNLLKGRKNERKRRSCCSTERKDFHYGRFDYFEQQFYIAHKRRYNVNKRLLYTTTSVEKSIKKRKPWPTTNSVTLTIAPPPAFLPVQEDTPGDVKQGTEGSCVLEPAVEEIKLCLVCKKEAMTGETLNGCRECSNLYHVSCHVADDITASPAGDDENGNHSTGESLPQRPKELCPHCLVLGKEK